MKKLLAWMLCLMLLTAAAMAEGAEIVIPDVTVKHFDIPETEGLAFVRGMKIAWNLGNTFDAIHDGFTGNELDIEKYWCQVKTTREMIQAVHQGGFQTIRIPVSWHNHVDADFRISEPWLNRVQEVVDWAIEEGMYVILNIHHDEEQFNPAGEKMAGSEQYVTAIWTQLAERFRDYDDHLIFESMNEPRMTNSQYEWWLDWNNPECREAALNVVRLNQLFVDTVRASGGNNATRYLMVPGYDASPASVLNESFTLPEDTAEGRLIVSVHAYTPYDFALNLSGTADFSLKNYQQTGEIGNFMNELYKKYVSNGIPVVIGEFGALDKKGNLQARVDFTAYYVASATARGMTVGLWDNHAVNSNGENFGMLNRRACTWYFPDILEAMMRYAPQQAAE